MMSLDKHMVITSIDFFLSYVTLFLKCVDIHKIAKIFRVLTMPNRQRWTLNLFISTWSQQLIYAWVSKHSHRVLIRTYRQICETMGGKLQWIASFINATAHLLTRELHFFRTFIDAIFDRMTFLWYVPY